MIPIVSKLGQMTAVVGTQWGDEGKGKATDYLGDKYDIVARAAGGANAGHTIVIAGEKHVFHLLPSASLHDKVQIVLGAGMVIHLATLLEEISLLEDKGIKLGERLHIAHNAHIVLELHQEIDAQNEEIRTKDAIGTTKRGIGPTYVDKAMRTGLRMESLAWEEAKLNDALNKILLFKTQYKLEDVVAKETEIILNAASKLADNVKDTSAWLHEQFRANKSILIEGAQATLLDIDHGTYPHVTSSSTTTAGALQGLGLAPNQLASSIGVVKAYCTRVGNGEFPTEDLSEAGQRLRKNGHEFGATTGRRRRCGWLSLADIKRAKDINGLTHLCLTKLDVLDTEPVIKVATEIKPDGSPVYKEMSGWQSRTVGITDFAELPQVAKEYVHFIENQVGIPVSFIGTGPARKQLIVR